MQRTQEIQTAAFTATEIVEWAPIPGETIEVQSSAISFIPMTLDCVREFGSTEDTPESVHVRLNRDGSLTCSDWSLLQAWLDWHERHGGMIDHVAGAIRMYLGCRPYMREVSLQEAERIALLD